MNWIPKWIDQATYLDLDDLVGEQWKHFTFWKGKELKDYYYISNMGRLKSCYCHHKRPKILPGTLDYTTGGYVNTMVRTADDSQVSMSFHQVVAVYFIGQCPSDIVNPVVDHIDSDKLDNRVTNLQWLSVGENTRKAISEGRCKEFENNGGWNRQACCIQEYPGKSFSSLKEASEFIHRSCDYISECIRFSRPIRHGYTGCILHVDMRN